MEEYVDYPVELNSPENVNQDYTDSAAVQNENYDIYEEIDERPISTGSDSSDESGSTESVTSKKKRTHKDSHGSSRRRHRRDKKKSRRSKRRGHRKPPPRTTPYKYWDVPPPGCENMTPLQYKALQSAGKVPVNMYAAGQVPMPADAPNAPLLLNTSLPFTGSAACRQARRIYVGNIPTTANEQNLMDYFNSKFEDQNLILAPGNPVIAVQIKMEKNYAFLEFRSVDEASQCLILDGIIFHDQTLKLRRPRDYAPLPGVADSASSLAPGYITSLVQETPDKLFIGGLPNYLTDDQVKELLTSFGQLRGFNLVKDITTGLSKGYAFFDYADPSVTDSACVGLSGMQLGEKRIVVQRASVGSKHAAQNAPNTRLQIPGLPDSLNNSGSASGNMGIGDGEDPTEVLCLLNMINPSELTDDEEYDDIVDDVRAECNRHGRVRSLEIPRPIPGVDVPGIGKIYVEFASILDCQKAAIALTGRKFNSRLVITSFYSPEMYHRREF